MIAAQRGERAAYDSVFKGARPDLQRCARRAVADEAVLFMEVVSGLGWSRRHDYSMDLDPVDWLKSLLTHLTDDKSLTTLMLVARELDGNAEEAAWTLLSRHLMPGVVAFAIRTLGCCRPCGEDVALEAFVRLWRARESFDGRCRVSTFLWQIAFNEARRSRKVGPRPGRCSPDCAEDEALDIVAVPDDTDEVVRRLERLRVLSQLPDDQREAAVRRFLLQEPLEQIALEMGLDRPAARALLNRAKRRLCRLFIRDAGGHP